MKLIWSPETALKAYIDTVQTCKLFKQSGEPEFIAAMAGGWNAKLIVEARSSDSPGGVSTSVGLAMAARHTCGRHVCIVPNEQSRLQYCQAMSDVGLSSPEVVVAEGEDVVVGVDFLVVDCRLKDCDRVLRVAKLSHKGAVIVCENASQRTISSSSSSSSSSLSSSSSSRFNWHGALEHGRRVMKSVFLPIGNGLDIAHVVANNNNNGGSVVCNHNRRRYTWIKHVDKQSGEEHVFRRYVESAGY